MDLKGRRLHFMGIGGIGVSALAEMALAAGAQVSGCDRDDSDLTRELAAKGITVAHGHDAAHMENQDLLIHTSAVKADHPERLAAGDRQEKRGQFLARLMHGRNGIGVSGTHGKTTTSWLAAHLFIEAGLDPTVFIGGIVPGLGDSNHRLGSGRFIAELDESDESFLLPELAVAVATNLESDHLSHYRDYDTLKAAFRRYAAGVEKRGLLVAGLDSPDLAEIFRAHSGRKLSFGIADGCDVAAAEVDSTPDGSAFTLRYRGRDLGRFRLTLPGRHNILNALAALGTALESGIPPDTLRSALPKAGGVGRRLELLARLGDADLYSDYAHHPTEVKASLAALRQAHPDGKILAVFQPHLYTRTRDYADDFGRALAAADAVLLVDIYPAREEPIPGVTTALLLPAAREGGGNVFGPVPLDAVEGEVMRRAGDFDVVALMGAGDIDAVARTLKRFRK